jgi:hypothetical protein
MPPHLFQSFGSMPQQQDCIDFSPSDLFLRTRMVSLERFAIPVAKANAKLPENLFLCPSGGETVKIIRFSETQRRDICEVLNK